MVKKQPVKPIKSKNKDRLATEERLILAAEQIFSKHGFKGATTRMIAKKADVNVALIARYFDGKYGLMIKFIERKALQHKYSDLTYPPQDNVIDECLCYAAHKFNFLNDDLSLLKIVIVQFLTDPKFLKKFQESLVIFDNHPQLEARLKKLIEDKKMSTDLEIEVIIETIEDHVFSLVITKILIDNLPAKEVLNKLKIFVRYFAQSLEYTNKNGR